jgi:hypothetical protein
VFPFNTSTTENVTGEVCQIASGAKTFIDTLPYNPVIIVSHKRVVASCRQFSMVTIEGLQIPYDYKTRYWDPSAVPSLPSYSNSDGVQMTTWYNQVNPNVNLTGISNSFIAPGFSQPYFLMTGAGIFPCFQMGSFQHVNTFDGSFTWIALVRFNIGGANVTSANWRTNGSAFLINGKIGTGNDDLCLGIDSSFLWVGMGTAGGADNFLQGTYSVVSAFTDPKLVVLRRDASTGLVTLRINKVNDGSATMTTGSLKNIPNIQIQPITGSSYISELYVYNNCIDDVTLLSIENYFQAFYDLSI